MLLKLCVEHFHWEFFHWGAWIVSPESVLSGICLSGAKWHNF